MIKDKLFVYTVAGIHGLLALVLFIAAILVFTSDFYEKHVVIHLFWTTSVFATFIVQKIYNGCPLTFLEKHLRAKSNTGAKNPYGASFAVYWVHELTGIRIPVQTVTVIMSIYVIIIIISWLPYFRKLF